MSSSGSLIAKPTGEPWSYTKNDNEATSEDCVLITTRLMLGFYILAHAQRLTRWDNSLGIQRHLRGGVVSTSVRHTKWNSLSNAQRYQQLIDVSAGHHQHNIADSIAVNGHHSWCLDSLIPGCGIINFSILTFDAFTQEFVFEWGLGSSYR